VVAKVNDSTQVALPIRNLISLVVGAALATWAYFGVIERLNQLETKLTLMTNDLEQNTEFRIKWPRGDMGSLPADSEQFMLIEHLTGELEKLTTEIESGQAPFDQQQKLTLDFYEKRIKNLEDRVEKLKDSQMEMIHRNNGINGH
jgi:exonuclease VII small subunit